MTTGRLLVVGGLLCNLVYTVMTDFNNGALDPFGPFPRRPDLETPESNSAIMKKELKKFWYYNL